MDIDLKSYQDYIAQLPDNKYISKVPAENIAAYIFDAYEDITTLYPMIKPTPRMIYKQLEYKLEGEQMGIDYMRRQGIETQKINDASVELKPDVISPYVMDLIRSELGSNRLRLGRLI